jgi:DNA repair protein RadC
LLLLNQKNRPIGFHVVSIGSLTASLLHPREVIKAIVLANAAAALLMHGHPSSGDPTPSSEDLQISRRLKELMELLGVKFLDSIVFGDGTFVSLVDDGYL